MQLKLRLLSADEELNERILGNIKDLKLEAVYSEHIDYVRELVRLAIISNSDYFKAISQTYDGLFDGEEELYRLVFHNYWYPKDFSKRPMSKLTRDILQNLGVSLKL